MFRRGAPVTFLEMARRMRAERRGAAASPELDAAPVVETRESVVAVRVRSPEYGDVWIALDATTASELVTEEPGVPVLQPLDVRRLRGKSPAAVRAVLEVLTGFPGSRVMQ